MQSVLIGNSWLWLQVCGDHVMCHVTGFVVCSLAEDSGKWCSCWYLKQKVTIPDVRTQARSFVMKEQHSKAKDQGCKNFQLSCISKTSRKDLNLGHWRCHSIGNHFTEEFTDFWFAISAIHPLIFTCYIHRAGRSIIPFPLSQSLQ